MLEFWIDNIFAMFGGRVFSTDSRHTTYGYTLLFSPTCSVIRMRQTSYRSFSSKNENKLTQSINFTFRYIDDVLSLNNSRFGDFYDSIYPIELEIKDTIDTDRSTSCLELHLEVGSDGRLRTKLYDKRDDFNFPIMNFPAAPAYGVYICQVIRYSRTCASYQDFLDRGLLLTRKLLNQGFLLVKLKSSLRKFYGHHHDLVDCYGISVSQMITDIVHL